MTTHLGTSARTLFLALALLLGAGWGTAQAVVITVLGVSYNVVLAPANTSFVDNLADIENVVPWWGNAAAAQQAATDFHAALGGNGADYGLTVNLTDEALFAHAYPNPFVDIYLTRESDGLVGSASVNGTFAFADKAYATATIVTVPEIDGNALFKALFILFALYLWIQVRRNRRAQG